MSCLPRDAIKAILTRLTSAERQWLCGALGPQRAGECLDHVLTINERHLKQVLAEYRR